MSWETTSISLKMVDKLIFLGKWKMTLILRKQKATSISRQMETTSIGMINGK